MTGRATPTIVGDVVFVGWEVVPTYGVLVQRL